MIERDVSAPVFVRPMLAHRKPDDMPIERYADGWVAEVKEDGQRVIWMVRNHEVMAWSRPGPGKKEGLPRTLPHAVADVCRTLPDGLYDGELTVVGGKSWDVSRKTGAGIPVLLAFDLLEALGESTVRHQYTTRRELLETATSKALSEHLQLVQQVPVSTDSYRAVIARGGEGLMLKREHSIYRPGSRSKEWLKCKEEKTAVLEVVGYKEAIGGPHSCLKLRDRAGIVITVKAPPWIVAAADQEEGLFLGKLVSVEYQTKTESGSYRHPRFDRLLEGR